MPSRVLGARSAALVEVVAVNPPALVGEPLYQSLKVRLMGALGGILIADYWVVRRQKLNLAALFDEQGEYRYTGGVNWRAVAALTLSLLPVVPGFVRAAMTPGGQVAVNSGTA